MYRALDKMQKATRSLNPIGYSRYKVHPAAEARTNLPWRYPRIPIFEKGFSLPSTPVSRALIYPLCRAMLHLRRDATVFPQSLAAPG